VDAHARASEEARARVVVLCASTIETLRIMLNSASPAHPRGLGGSSGRLGLGLMDHVLAGIGGPIPADDRRQTTDDRGEGAYDLGRVVGFRVGPVRGTGFTRSYAIQGAVGRESDAWYLLAHGEMLAGDANRVTLHPRRTDAWGVPIAHLACAPGAEERAMAGDQLRVMRELAGAAGLEVRTPPSGRSLDALAFRLWRRRLVGPAGAFLPGSAAHEIGGAAMGTDPARSVLDPHGRCWDADNVYIADGACFPAGCWQNVTLTIMALAVRASGRIVAEARAGRL
jgi:choline dehydrogenase-like flavoprotein